MTSGSASLSQTRRFLCLLMDRHIAAELLLPFCLRESFLLFCSSANTVLELVRK